MKEILERRSIRKFTGNLISKKDLENLLRAGFQAPSAHNKQAREYIVLRDKKILEKVSSVHKYGKMLGEAGTGIIVCGDLSSQDRLGYLVADCSASIQNMLTMAQHLGLGAVWCGIHPIEKLEEDIRQILNLPDNILPVGMVVVGEKAEDKECLDRYREDRIHIDKW